MWWILGVDFGTSNTAAAVRWPDNVVKPVALSANSLSMPSAVVLTAGDVLKVGDVAVHSQQAFASSFVGSPKTLLGGEPKFLGERLVEPKELAAAVLKRVREEALKFNNRELPVQVRLTHPADWPPRKLDDLKAAAVLAGFDPSCLYFVPEPIAAVNHYGSEVVTGQRILVFDFGAGTCDVAILERGADGQLTILDQAGDQTLGGNLLDRRIFDWVVEHTSQNNDPEFATWINSRDGLGASLRLLKEVRIAKETLSTHEDADFMVETSDGSSHRLLITRQEFEALIADEIRRAKELIVRVISRVGEPYPSAVYVTGGSSRVPAITTLVKDMTGQPPAMRDDPKLVVAEGAVTDFAPPRSNEKTPPKMSQRPINRKLMAALGAAGGLLALLIGIGIFWPEDEPTPDPPLEGNLINCWDGTDSTKAEGCPELTGLPALQWAFPFNDGEDPDSCEPASSAVILNWGKPDEAFMCTWAADNGGMVLMRWDDPQRALADIRTTLSEAPEEWEESDFTIEDEPEAVGLVWTSDFQTDESDDPFGHNEFWLYDELGMAAYVVGWGESAKEAEANFDSLDSHWYARDATEIREVSASVN
jgi:actin-like ATPase involved in cell morphogenesis